MNYCAKKNGFTFIEVIIIIVILIILTTVSGSVFYFFRRQSDLNNSVEAIISRLREAQSNAIGSEDSSQYGIYFESDQYIVFKGPNFISREISYDRVYQLSERVEIYELNLDGPDEVIFEKITGTTNQIGYDQSGYGSISLRIKDDIEKSKIIYVENSGQVGLLNPVPPSDENRDKDSRHVHLDYIRNIDTISETLKLDFEGLVEEIIVIADNIVESQIFWEGEVDVDGEIQKIKIHTHRLNDSDTQFCVHRDRRYNNKSLTITISEDGSGTLLEYSADGLNVNSNSIYVSNINWE